MDRVGPTIVGRRSTPGAEAARELLTRNEVPHRWVDLDRDPLAPLLETESLSAGRLPLVLFPDGTQLEGPGDYTELVSGRTQGVPRAQYLISARWRAELAAGGGLPTTPTHELYDVVIVGAGPATSGVPSPFTSPALAAVVPDSSSSNPPSQRWLNELSRSSGGIAWADGSLSTSNASTPTVARTPLRGIFVARMTATDYGALIRHAARDAEAPRLLLQLRVASHPAA